MPRRATVTATLAAVLTEGGPYTPFKNFIGSSGAAPLRTSKWSWGVLTLPV
jgi:hypothetical protein